MSSEHALVIATYSQRMRLRLADGAEVDARIKGKRLRPVCGDRVTATAIDKETDWLITAIGPRDNELTRPNVRGRVEVLAANIDYLVAVAAAEPRADWFIIDRYLCAAELMNVPAGVIFNKIDLDGDAPATRSELDTYASIGYDTASCSAETGAGIADVQRLFENRCGIIVGQSGVGKSSIINRLRGEALQKTAAVSGKTREGRHTTVNSVMISLPGGGAVIDSPGVRDYAPAMASSRMAAVGFREIVSLAVGCRFANCRHLREPGCAVKDAVERGTMAARRYESYKRIVNLTNQLSQGRSPG